MFCLSLQRILFGGIQILQNPLGKQELVYLIQFQFIIFFNFQCTHRICRIFKYFCQNLLKCHKQVNKNKPFRLRNSFPGTTYHWKTY